ncbi:MAG TPA: hypothetical protein VLE71_06930 [Actinomycetota bacterium]|nr:hypothetical protein [Actinomycetota bacterium]
MRRTLSCTIVVTFVLGTVGTARAWPVDAGAPETRSPIALPPVPTQGVAIQGPASVVLVDLDGRILARVRGMHLAGDGPPARVVLLEGPEGAWLLRPGLDLLRPVTDRHAAALDQPDQDHLGRLDIRRPIGSRYRGVVVGHWRYALPSPHGDLYLAQWSGECEVPTAYFARPGARPIPVVGPPEADYVPESFALGWTFDARAVVLLPQGACGSSMQTPGVYLFSSPNVGTLLHPVGGWRGALMWGQT